MKDRIEKTIDLKAPIDRVWRALTDHREFGEWFRVELDSPFEVGKTTRGRVTYPGYEHLKWHATVRTLEPERLFAFSWHPYEVDSEATDAPETLVEFSLEPIVSGTRVVISESGFSALPADARRLDAFRENEKGWSIQAENIAAYVES